MYPFRNPVDLVSANLMSKQLNWSFSGSFPGPHKEKFYTREGRGNPWSLSGLLSSSGTGSNARTSSTADRHPSADSMAVDRGGMIPAFLVGDVFLACNTLSGITSSMVRWMQLIFNIFYCVHQIAWWLKKALFSPLQPDLDVLPEQHKPPGKRLRRQLQNGLKTGIDNATKLLVRMALPIDGKRSFFVSRNSAEIARRELVLERRKKILERRDQHLQIEADPTNVFEALERCVSLTTRFLSSRMFGRGKGPVIHCMGKGSQGSGHPAMTGLFTARALAHTITTLLSYTYWYIIYI